MRLSQGVRVLRSRLGSLWLRRRAFRSDARENNVVSSTAERSDDSMMLCRTAAIDSSGGSSMRRHNPSPWGRCETDDSSSASERSRHDEAIDPVIVPPPPSPSPPLLLLEGDQMYISHDGLSRTLYKLHSCEEASVDLDGGGFYYVEERWCLDSAQKHFILRKSSSSSDFSWGTHDDSAGMHSTAPFGDGIGDEGIARLVGPSLGSIQLQEIVQGVYGSAGTGSMTWESSIAMALHFSMEPHDLRGDVIEVGSGVGLGGMLSQMTANVSMNKQTPDTCSSSTEGWVESLTLTDCSEEVLDQCRNNVRCNDAAAAAGKKGHTAAIQVMDLDWYDMPTKAGCQEKKYDTVIASDCAYLHSHIIPLSETISRLLAHERGARAHIFGPYNRAALHELIHELKVGKNMSVHVDSFELDRCRLKAPPQPPSPENVVVEGSQWGTKSQDIAQAGDTLAADDEKCAFASKGVAQFLHVTAWHGGGENCNGCANEMSLKEID